LLKEIYVLTELEREEALELIKTMVYFHGIGAQVLSRKQRDQATGSVVERYVFDLYKEAKDRARLAIQQMGHLISPWDDSWKKAIEKTKDAIHDADHQIGETGLSDRSLVKMIKEYEELKAKYGRRLERKLGHLWGETEDGSVGPGTT